LPKNKALFCYYDENGNQKNLPKDSTWHH